MKLIRHSLALVGTAVLFFSTSLAAQAEFVENNYVCEDAYMEVATACGDNAVAVEKKRLNDLYMSVYPTLGQQQKARLDKEQRAWLKTRNEKCDFNYARPMNNSVVYAMVSADVCVANETQKRSRVIYNEYDIK
ncbi:lysozyme inhibitor LprI family protein [Psychrobacter sp.]|uniref:lysozyme inhibitor LprI family protein n=1 Tax=Psychrobacter sp. TaxID=56811 RepID=UPI003F9C4637